LSADELRAEVPMIGRLQYDADPHRRDAKLLLMPLAGSTDACAELHSAKLRKVDKRGLLFVGVEQVFKRRQANEYAQAIWAWPVSEDDIRPPPPDPVDQDERDEQLAPVFR
jgi:hypothetical protein